MTEKLKPCPFCGGAPTEYAIEPHTHAMMLGDFKMPDHDGAHVIECACGAGFIDDTREAVVTRWNTRTLTAAQPAQTPADSELLDYLDTLAKRVVGSDLHCFGGRVVLYVRTGIGAQIKVSGAGTAREAIRAAIAKANTNKDHP